MSTDVPLLNDYKKKFVRNRVFQTFLAGLRLTGVPWYTIPIQFTLFLSPLGAVIPYLVLNDSNVIISLALAGILSGWALILQIFAKFLQFLSSRKSGDQVESIGNDPLEEENEVVLNGFCDLKTWTFILPCKKYWINIPIHATLCGFMMFLTSHFLLMESIGNSIGDVLPPLLVLVTSTFPIIQAFHALVIISPPETAMYRYEN